MLRSLWTQGCSVLLIGVSLLGNGLPWQRAADDPYAFVRAENTVQIACVGNSDLYSALCRLYCGEIKGIAPLCTPLPVSR